MTLLFVVLAFAAGIFTQAKIDIYGMIVNKFKGK
jgi:hypothetical protein